MRHLWQEYVGRDLRITRIREKAATRRGGGVPGGEIEREHPLGAEHGASGRSHGGSQGRGPWRGRGQKEGVC